MKRAVSISLGSVKRDKKATITLFGEEISIERIGTDGDVEKATQLYNELDGKVDAFGVGGIDLGMTIGGRYYPIHAAQKLVAGVKHTPVVDGGGLHSGDNQNLERTVAQFIEQEIGDEVRPKRVLITTGVDRYSSALSFAEAGYDLLFGDLAFALGIPIPIRSLSGLRLLGRILMPIVGRMPIAFLYPTGEKQEEIFLGREIGMHRDYSETTAREIDEEVKRIVDEAETRAESIVKKNLDKLKALAEKLLDKEILSGDEVDKILKDGRQKKNRKSSN